MNTINQSKICKNNRSIDSLKEIRSTLSELQLNLAKSEIFKTKLRLSADENAQRNKELEEQIQKEKKRNERLLSVMRSVDSSQESSPRTPELSNSGHYSFDSISPVLMQYKYDELSLSHKRCLKQLNKKEKVVNDLISQKEELQEKFENIADKYKTIQKQVEFICCKYLTLQARKTEEIIQLKEMLNHFLMTCVCYKKRIRRRKRFKGSSSLSKFYYENSSNETDNESSD